MSLVIAIAMAWLLLAKSDYMYSLWYDHAGIAEAIDKYAPQNRYRQHFADTSREERIRLFSKIVTSVHSQGHGLEDIRYKTRSNYTSSLLHKAEVVHLQDVAKIITNLTRFFMVTFVLWLACTLFFVLKRRQFPSLKDQSKGFLLLSVVIILLLVIFGWEELFKQFHILVFPAENQWFFFYQDSLMATLMWAPNLFTYIGIAWAILAIVFFSLILLGQKKVSRYLALD